MAQEVTGFVKLQFVDPRAIVLALKKSFGANLRELRKQKYKRSKDLAAALGVTPAIVSRWENDGTGPPEARTLVKLAMTIECSVDALLDGLDGYVRRDLTGQAGDQRSHPPERRADVPASPEIEARVLEPQRYADLVDETEDIATRLLDIAGELRNARLSDQPAEDSQPRSRRRHRKTG